MALKQVGGGTTTLKEFYSHGIVVTRGPLPVRQGGSGAEQSQEPEGWGTPGETSSYPLVHKKKSL